MHTIHAHIHIMIYLAQSSRPLLFSIGIGYIVCIGIIPHAVFTFVVNYYNV